MSRTRHHRGSRNRRLGEDFGAKYKCDKHYGAGIGKDAKHEADSERRNDSKNIIRKELESRNDE